jgi:glycosyltransferase involved in cell wall biosynthesis
VIVGLNLLYMLPEVVGGTESYAAGLIHGFSRVDADVRFVVYCNRESADWPLPADPRFSRAVCPVRARSRLARYWYEQRRLSAQVAADGVHLLHSLGYVAPLALPCPSVVTVHDLHYLAFGELAGWPRRVLLSYFVRRSIRGAAAVITGSRFSQGAISRAYGLPLGSIDVILYAPKPRSAVREVTASPAARASARPYLVAFGGVSPNKNLPRLLRSFDLARSRGVAHDLVLLGRLPDSLRVDTGGVVTTGYLDDGTLAATLGGADALLFPSIYEGFGLPVLEAMAAGVPVACSNVSAIPEIAGDAALYFDPSDETDMAAKIAEISGDESLRARLRAKGRSQVAAFSWERAARETLSVYQRILARGTRAS